MLAQGHRHGDIVQVLQLEKKRRSNWFPSLNEVWGLLFGKAGNSKMPLTFFLISVLLWGYPMYVIRVRARVFTSHCVFKSLWSHRSACPSRGTCFADPITASYTGTSWCGFAGSWPTGKTRGTCLSIPSPTVVQLNRSLTLTSGKGGMPSWIDCVIPVGVWGRSGRSTAAYVTVAFRILTTTVPSFITVWGWGTARGFSSSWWAWPSTARLPFTSRRTV